MSRIHQRSPEHRVWASASFPTTPGPSNELRRWHQGRIRHQAESIGFRPGHSTYLGGGVGEEGRSIAVDGTRQCLYRGMDRLPPGNSFPATAGAFQTVHGGNGDAFVTKSLPQGPPLSTRPTVGGDGAEIAYDLAVDGSGEAYLTRHH